MKIIIAGVGELGSHLARLLSYESLDITLIDIDPLALIYAKNHLDVRVIDGDSTSIAVLEQAQVQETDLVIGVSQSEAVNITTCAIAKQMGAKQTIARIYNTEYLEKKNRIGFKRFGIDELISPELLTSREISQLIKQTAFNDTFKFENGALQMIGVQLTSRSEIIHKSVKEVGANNPGLAYVPVAIKRSGAQKTIIPHGSTVFEEGDQVYFITIDDGVEKILKKIGQMNYKIKDVMILGGSKIGYLVAKMLSGHGLRIKLIERDKTKAESLSNKLSDALVLHADGRNMDFLKEEALENMDAFIAVTDRSETNIMACLAAREGKVKKSIALVENFGYYQLTRSAGIDTIINKKTLAANEIFRFVRKGKIMAVHTLTNMNAQILEFKAGANSKATHHTIKDLDFPEEAVIGGVIRNGKGLIALGDFKIEQGDRLVICSLPKAIQKVESLFE